MARFVPSILTFSEYMLSEVTVFCVLLDLRLEAYGGRGAQGSHREVWQEPMVRVERHFRESSLTLCGYGSHILIIREEDTKAM